MRLKEKALNGHGVRYIAPPYSFLRRGGELRVRSSCTGFSSTNLKVTIRFTIFVIFAYLG